MAEASSSKAVGFLYPGVYYLVGNSPPGSPDPVVKAYSASQFTMINADTKQPITPSDDRPAQDSHMHNSEPHPPPHASKPTPSKPHSTPHTSSKHGQTNPSKPRKSLFEFSTCTGHKRALCIGVNYIGQKDELKGCINDAHHMRKFLMKQYGFKAENIVMLTDDNPDPQFQPTRHNMLVAMEWLVKDAKRHDSLFFHYSGHGGQQPDKNGDEPDGFDEIIFPVDYQKNGVIVDDDMNEIMVQAVPKGCRLVALYDSCHSGTALDLPYVYGTNGRLQKHQVSRQALPYKSSPADVISWSACKDTQTSVDTRMGGIAVGAMSYAFIKCLSENPNQSYHQLIKTFHDLLYPKFKQTPQLGCSHTLDTDLSVIHRC